MSRPVARVSTRRLVAIGVLVSLVLAGVVSFYASKQPDGLASVAHQLGFESSETAHASDGSPFAGYRTRGITDARLSGAVAGVVGVLLVGVIGGGLFMALRRRGDDQSGDQTGDQPPDRVEH